MNKVCRVCCERLTINHFTKNISTKDGLSNMCKTCGAFYRKMLEERKHKQNNLEIKPFVIMREGCIVRFD